MHDVNCGATFPQPTKVLFHSSFPVSKSMPASPGSDVPSAYETVYEPNPRFPSNEPTERYAVVPELVTEGAVTL